MKIGIIGAGTMGAGIAQAFIVFDEYEVVLCDIKKEYADKGLSRIVSSLEKQALKGRMGQAEKDAALSRIKTGTNQDAAGCGLIIEAALEDLHVKKQLFAEMHLLCKPETLFTTNTSSLSVTELSHDIGRPVIGMHFFNPAPVMKLVEIVTAPDTPDELVLQIADIARSIGKTPVTVQDSAGFVVNRLLIPMINEAIGLLSEGTAAASDIDTAMKLGANHPMGPLELGDLIGLDVCLAIMEVLHRDTGDQKYRPHPLLRKMVRGGYLGKKSGRGFYQY